jgi:hypothetical protein
MAELSTPAPWQEWPLIYPPHTTVHTHRVPPHSHKAWWPQRTNPHTHCLCKVGRRGSWADKGTRISEGQVTGCQTAVGLGLLIGLRFCLLSQMCSTQINATCWNCVLSKHQVKLPAWNTVLGASHLARHDNDSLQVGVDRYCDGAWYNLLGSIWQPP